MLSRGITPKDGPEPSLTRMADWGKTPRQAGLGQRISAELRHDPRSMFAVVSKQQKAQKAARMARYSAATVEQPAAGQSLDEPQA